MNTAFSTWQKLARQGTLDYQVNIGLLSDPPTQAALALLATEELSLLNHVVVNDFMNPEFREKHSDAVIEMDTVIELLNRVSDERFTQREQADPWREMAIEAQFREVIKDYGNSHEPATLQYIEKRMEDEGWDGHRDEIEPIQAELRHLWNRGSLHGGYSDALVKLLGDLYCGDDGDTLTLADAMNLVLWEPDDLMQCIIGFVHCYND